jgi:hypothetical protein
MKLAAKIQRDKKMKRRIGDIELESDMPILFIYLEQCEFSHIAAQIRVARKRTTIVTIGMNDEWYNVIPYVGNKSLQTRM